MTPDITIRPLGLVFFLMVADDQAAEREAERVAKLQPRSDPTPSEIAERSAAVRATWTDRERRRRAGIRSFTIPTCRRV